LNRSAGLDLLSRRRPEFYKLRWTLTGSEFVGRYQFCETFYAGHPDLVCTSCDRETC
jgi:aromatic ring hydroxylase